MLWLLHQCVFVRLLSLPRHGAGEKGKDYWVVVFMYISGQTEHLNVCNHFQWWGDAGQARWDWEGIWKAARGWLFQLYMYVSVCLKVNGNDYSDHSPQVTILLLFHLTTTFLCFGTLNCQKNESKSRCYLIYCPHFNIFYPIQGTLTLPFVFVTFYRDLT